MVGSAVTSILSGASTTSKTIFNPNFTLKKNQIEQKSSSASASGAKSRKRNHRTLSDDEGDERVNDPQELDPESVQQIEPLPSSADSVLLWCSLTE